MAVKDWPAQASTAAVAGSTVSAAEAVTVTGATKAIAGSARLVATTWQVAATAGAAYAPSGPMDPQPGPSCTLQVTPVSAVPETVATNLADPPAGTVAEGGSTRRATPCAEGGGGGGGADVVQAARSARTGASQGLRMDIGCTSSFHRRARAEPVRPGHLIAGATR